MLHARITFENSPSDKFKVTSALMKLMMNHIYNAEHELNNTSTTTTTRVYCIIMLTDAYR